MMPQIILEDKIKLSPDENECVENVTNYAGFLLYRQEENKPDKKKQDVSVFWGSLKSLGDGMQIQRKIRDEWN